MHQTINVSLQITAPTARRLRQELANSTLNESELIGVLLVEALDARGSREVMRAHWESR